MASVGCRTAVSKALREAAPVRIKKKIKKYSFCFPVHCRHLKKQLTLDICSKSFLDQGKCRFPLVLDADGVAKLPPPPPTDPPMVVALNNSLAVTERIEILAT